MLKNLENSFYNKAKIKISLLPILLYAAVEEDNIFKRKEYIYIENVT
ncbi:hypothetical protein [Rickettsia oklahomensis]|uniref:Uncharacterized protein n=1 Tax=Rickettsia oklahomensis TaxID=3141789 RepID=A0AAU7C015_9RICK